MSNRGRDFYERISDFILGAVATIIFIAFLCVAVQWSVANQPVFAPAPPQVFAASGAYTAGSALEDEVTRCEGWFHESIDQDVPFGFRWAAHKMARWGIRTTMRIQIAAHGHQVAPILRAAEPYADRLFKQDVADGLKRAREVAEMPVEQLGPVASKVRAQAGDEVQVSTFW